MSKNPLSDEASSCWSGFVDTESPPKGAITPQTNAHMMNSLHTPIAMPQRLLDSNSVPAATPEDNTDSEAEERLTSAFVHAVCRLHEATEVVAATCNHFISEWTGLEVKEATVATVLAASRLPDVPLYRPGREYRRILQDMSADVEYAAILLQVLLRSEQASIMIAGATAGLALAGRSRLMAQNARIDAHNEAVLPLSALEDERNAETLAAFTRQITALDEVPSIGSSSYNGFDSAMRVAHIMEHSQLMPYLYESRRRQRDSQTRFAHFMSAVSAMEVDPDTRGPCVAKCINAAIYEACMAAENLKLFTDMAHIIVTSRKRFTRYMTTISRAFRGKPYDSEMRDLLDEAHAACERAITATQAVRAVLIKPAMPSILEGS